jgi:cell division protease FtsH
MLSSSKDSVGKLAKKKKSSSSSLDVAAATTTTTTTFDDIYGIDNAKHDVMELVDSLRHPEQYRLVGARPPRGILLEGPPGTGKTSLARACANVANVPLIYCSGSDFVETYVGKGAARVRQLFAQARTVAKGSSSSSSSSCLIFIDELDCIGKARRGGGSGVGNGSSDEAEQTLNALLTQMDGLGDDDTGGIFVLAATNS